MNVQRHQTSVFISSARAGSRRSETNTRTHEQHPVTSQQVREPITSTPWLNARDVHSWHTHMHTQTRTHTLLREVGDILVSFKINYISIFIEFRVFQRGRITKFGFENISSSKSNLFMGKLLSDTNYSPYVFVITLFIWVFWKHVWRGSLNTFSEIDNMRI